MKPVGRRPGGPKTGGRTKGVPNKNSLKVLDRLNELGIDLLKELMDEIRGLDRGFDKAHMYMNLMEYCYPKRKSLEGEIQLPDSIGQSNVNVTDLKELIAVARGKVGPD